MRFSSRYIIRFLLLSGLLVPFLCAGLSVNGWAQGPTPDNGGTIFPGGAYVSYNSVFTTRRPLEREKHRRLNHRSSHPTFLHETPFTFAWSFRRDFQVTAVVPIVSTHVNLLTPRSTGPTGGTGLGDTLLLFKYRFLRRDSDRGTTQASFTLGPKLPTGRTHLRENGKARLPVGLQPGSGSTDLYLNLGATRTGLFGLKRLVADQSLIYLWRREGSQRTRLGDYTESRFWLSYRPYQSASQGREWWIGPAVTWQHAAPHYRAGLRETDSGSTSLSVGVTNYFSPRRGLLLWAGADFPVVQNLTGIQAEMRRRLSFGITQQFRPHR